MSFPAAAGPGSRDPSLRYPDRGRCWRFSCLVLLRRIKNRLQRRGRSTAGMQAEPLRRSGPR